MYKMYSKQLLSLVQIIILTYRDTSTQVAQLQLDKIFMDGNITRTIVIMYELNK